jgi:glycyl-tRNA synthetase beta subunit
LADLLQKSFSAAHQNFESSLPMRWDDANCDKLPDWLRPIHELTADVAEHIVEEEQPAPIVEPQPESNVWIAA